MKIIIRTCLAFSLCVAATAAADSVPSMSLPGDAGSGRVLSTTSSGQAPLNTVEASRIPRRDTRTPLVCSAADAAPRLADRVAEGSCRSHTQQHEVEGRGSAIPWQPSAIDIHAISGR